MGKPRLTWRGFHVAGTSLVGGTNLAFDLSAIGSYPSLTALGVFGDYTVRRVRWSLYARDIDAESTDVAQVAAWGLVIVNIDAFNSGVGALPDPLSDAADWFGHGYVAYSSLLAAGRDTSRVYELDNRAMRRVNENSQVPIIVLAGIAGETMHFAFGGRLLVSHGRQ